MVRLKGIKRSGTIMECDIIPEDSTQRGHLAVNLSSGKIVSYTLPAGYEGCLNHVSHARKRLMELSKQDDIPEETLVMWY